MAGPHPFYRFVPAPLNAGFMPGLDAVSEKLESLYIALTGPDYTGQDIRTSLTEMRNEVDNWNRSFLTNFKLVWPSPRPDFSNPGTATFLVYDAQMLATDDSQKIEIVLSWDSDQEIEVGYTITYPGPTTAAGDYSPSLIATELQVQNALRIVAQTGSAFFPNTYRLVNGIAVSGLARGRNWTLDANENVVPQVAISYPFEPYKPISLSALSGDETYILTLMEQIIQEGLLDATIGNLETFAENLSWPQGYTCTVTQNVETYERIEFCIEKYGADRGFVLIGRKDSGWLFQRFVSVGEESIQGDFLAEYTNSEPLPYIEVLGKYLNLNVYDLDFCEFQTCEPPAEIYQLVIKPGDQYQFNIPITDGNLYGLEQCQIGLFDKDLNFVQQIGEAVTPELTNCLSVVLPFISTGGASPEYISWSDFIANLNGLSGDSIFAATANQTSNYTGISASTQIQDGIIEVFGEWSEITWPTDPQEFIDIIANLVDIEITGEVIPIEDTYRVRLNFCFPNCQPNVNAVVMYYESPGSGETVFVTFQETLQKPIRFPSQLEASVTIPSVPDGCYFFGCYVDNSYEKQILSLSQPLKLDASDCYSTILEYWGQDDSIVEGFEYFNDWKQRVRVPFNGGGEKQIIDENVYRQSNGVYRRPQNKQDLSIDLHTDYIDLPIQKAIADATRHPFLVWENQSIFVNSELDVATIQDFTRQTSFETFSQMKFSALLQGYQPTNNNCASC